MKRSSMFSVRWAVLALVVITAGLVELAYCQTRGVALLLQQTPGEAGIITPNVGVHHFKLNTKVTLTAVPKPGYRFLLWLGDVGSPTATTTIVYLDAPKIIIAVFEPAESGLSAVVDEPQIQGTGGGGGLGDDLIASPPIGLRPRRPWIGSFWLTGPRPEHITIIIPEPATVALLALGGLFILAGPRPKKQAR